MAGIPQFLMAVSETIPSLVHMDSNEVLVKTYADYFHSVQTLYLVFFGVGSN